jgi:outer membrane lipoprotein SlyB
MAPGVLVTGRGEENHMRKSIYSAAMIAGLSFSLFAQTDRIPAGTEITVRTTDTIDARHPSDSRIYRGVVDQDVSDASGRVLIPRGSDAELIMRDAEDDTIVVDLEALQINGRYYTVAASGEPINSSGQERKEGVGANKRTGKYVGGGALIGGIIGAIAGGGKGAAIGAATGAGAGAVGQTVTRGGSVKLPSESLITFRLDRSLAVSDRDNGYSRDGRHYHRRDRDDADRSRFRDRDRFNDRDRDNDRNR